MRFNERYSIFCESFRPGMAVWRHGKLYQMPFTLKHGAEYNLVMAARLLAVIGIGILSLLKPGAPHGSFISSAAAKSEPSGVAAGLLTPGVATDPSAAEQLHIKGWKVYSLAKLQDAGSMATSHVSNSYCLYQCRPAWFYVYRESDDGFGTLYAAVATKLKPFSPADWKISEISRDAALCFDHGVVTSPHALGVFYLKRAAGNQLDLMCSATTAKYPAASAHWRQRVVRHGIARSPKELPQLAAWRLQKAIAIVYCKLGRVHGTLDLHYLSTATSDPSHYARWRDISLDTLPVPGEGEFPQYALDLAKFSLLTCDSRPVIVQCTDWLRSTTLDRLWWALVPNPKRAADWHVFQLSDHGISDITQVFEFHKQPLLIGKMQSSTPQQPGAGSVPCVWSPALKGRAVALRFPGLADVEDGTIHAALGRKALYLIAGTQRVVFACASREDCLKPAAWCSYELINPSASYPYINPSLFLYGNCPVVTYLQLPEPAEGQVLPVRLSACAAKSAQPAAASAWHRYELGSSDYFGADYSSYEEHLDWPEPALEFLGTFPDGGNGWTFFTPKRARPASRQDWRGLQLDWVMARDAILAPLSTGYGVHIVDIGENHRMQLYFGIPLD